MEYKIGYINDLGQRGWLRVEAFDSIEACQKLKLKIPDSKVLSCNRIATDDSIGKRAYVQRVADVLVDTYGDTLKESGTDVKMAQAVIKSLTEFLFFHPFDISLQEFSKWRKKRLEND